MDLTGFPRPVRSEVNSRKFSEDPKGLKHRILDSIDAKPFGSNYQNLLRFTEVNSRKFSEDPKGLKLRILDSIDTKPFGSNYQNLLRFT